MKIKKYVMDETKDWEGRYKDLEAHHIEETTLLLKKLTDIRLELEEVTGAYLDLEEEFDQFRWDHEDK